MTREIKFRAKIVMDIEPLAMKKGNWVEGHYYEDLQDGEWCSWIQERDDIITYKVDKNTLGQFTGLLDKNGKEIYEGDIYRYDNPDSINEVSYCAGGGFAGFDLTPAIHSENRLLDVEVIGNIHDNPELLKAETL